MEFRSVKYRNRSRQIKTGILIGGRILHKGRYRHDIVIAPVEEEVKSFISQRELEKTPELDQAGTGLDSSLKIIAIHLQLNVRGWKSPKGSK